MTDDNNYRTLESMSRKCKICGKATNDLQSYCRHIDHDHSMNAQAKARYQELDRAKARGNRSSLRLP